MSVDPNRIALVGESARGQIAAALAKASEQAAAVVPFYASVDFIADMERCGGLNTFILNSEKQVIVGRQ